VSLSDVMSAANLAIYPEIGLVIFLFVFLSVAVRVYRGDPQRFERARHLPLEEEESTHERP
jgi:hypothetical protein